jgi:hypothetical protein
MTTSGTDCDRLSHQRALWVRETTHTARDLPLRLPQEPGMIR